MGLEMECLRTETLKLGWNLASAEADIASAQARSKTRGTCWTGGPGPTEAEAWQP